MLMLVLSEFIAQVLDVQCAAKRQVELLIMCTYIQKYILTINIVRYFSDNFNYSQEYVQPIYMVRIYS